MLITNDSVTPAVSADGRYVAFQSRASNLISGDTNNANDIFVRDTVAGTTTRVSTSSEGIQADGASSSVSISSDGLYVAFKSLASNLVSSDTNGAEDVFRAAVHKPTTLVVYNTLDADPLVPGSLRNALRLVQSNDTIQFDEQLFGVNQSNAATVINVLNPLPALDDGRVTLDAKDRRVTVNGSAAGTASGLLILSSNNVIQGLSITGFNRSGISIRSRARKNLIGGNRNSGLGANGSGLRLSQNGSFAIEIDGVGTDSNTVKGCWIGVSSSGLDPMSNLAGILIRNGAKNNVLGSTVSGEQNVISGNIFEGVAVADAGSDGTVILGNFIGAAAIETVAPRTISSRAEEVERINGRSSIANGASGIFLSTGTQNNTVGGTNNGEDNLVGFNGGAGIEVRTAASRKNSSKSNRIARNKNGGIRLFDGSNNNITPPSFDGVDRLPTRFARAVGATVRVRGSSTAAEGSVVEVFRDRGDQGEQIIGRANIASGKWQVEGDLLPDDNVTATVTDPDGNTSPFALFGRVPDSTSGTPVILSSTSAAATSGVPFNYRVAATSSPTDFDALNLPSGMAVNHTTGVISGIPTVTGTFVIDLAASNTLGTGVSTLTLTVAPIAVGAPILAEPLSVSAMVGAAFSYSITTAPPNSATSFAANNLPTGLSVDTITGVISGMPTSGGIFAVQISAINALGASTTTATFTILSGLSNTDSDGDGVSDTLEALAQTDILSAGSTPTLATTPLVVSKTSLSLSFSSAKDKLKLSLGASGSTAPISAVSVLIGELVESVVVDAKGKGSNGTASISVKAKNGVSTLSLSLSNKNLEPGLEGLNFTDRSTAGKSEALPLPVALLISSASGKIVHQGQATLNYKATGGKSGKATQAK